MGVGPALFAMIVLAVAFSIVCVVGWSSERKVCVSPCCFLLSMRPS